jgi:hypothetical protein
MFIPQGIQKINQACTQITNLTETAAALFRESGDTATATALFRFRNSIRLGLPAADTQHIFEKHIKNIVLKK